MIRAVIDTNVVVSGLLSPSGNEALILLAVRQGLVRPCVSPDILDEYRAVLARPKFAFPEDEVSATLAMLQHAGELFVPEGQLPQVVDPGDAKFLHCAEVSGADCVVTGNKRHFPQDSYWSARLKRRPAA